MKKLLMAFGVVLVTGAGGFFAGRAAPRTHPLGQATAIGVGVGTRTDAAAAGEMAREMDGTLAGAIRFAAEMRASTDRDLISTLKLLLGGTVRPAALGLMYRQEIIAALVERGAFVELLELRPAAVGERDAYLVAVTKAICDSSPEQLEAALSGLGDRERLVVGEAFLTYLGERDPQRGLRLVESDKLWRQQAGRLFGAWAERAPEEACAAAMDLKSRTGISEVNSVLYAWAGKDRDAARKFIEAQPESERSGLYHSYMNQLANSSPELLVEEVQANPAMGTGFVEWAARSLADQSELVTRLLDGMPIGEARSAFIGGIAEGLAHEPEAAIGWIDQLEAGDRSKAVAVLWNELGRNGDPEFALELALSHLSGDEQSTAISGLANDLAARGFRTAVSTLQEKLEPDIFRKILPSLFAGNPHIQESAAERLESIPEGLDPELRLAVIGRLAGDLEYSEEVSELLEMLEGEERARVVEKLIGNAWKWTPENVQRWAELLSPEQRVGAAVRMVDRLSDTDPAAAARYLLALPERSEGEKGKAIAQLVGGWAYESATEASSFVRKLPPGTLRDRGAVALVGSMCTFDLSMAGVEFAQIVGTAERAEALQKLAMAWKREDAERGRTVLASLARTPAERERLEAALSAP